MLWFLVMVAARSVRCLRGGEVAINYGALSPAARRFEEATALRVLAMSRAVVVVEKPSGLRSVPAFGPSAALVAAHAAAAAAQGGPSAALAAAFERPTRRERWNAVAARAEFLPREIRDRADSLPRTVDRFVKFATGPAGGHLGRAAAREAYDRLKAAVEAAEIADGMEESDSVLVRAKRDARWAEACSVHRLDYATSGVLCLALDARAAAHLSDQWRRRTVEKAYDALLVGDVDGDRGDVDLPLARRDAAKRSGDASRMVVVDDKATKLEDGLGPPKPSRTSYEVTGRFDGATRVRLVPHTGRLHQLRAHCAAIGHPICGDTLYGDALGARRAADRLCLHAAALSFVDPDTGLPFRVESALAWDGDRVLRDRSAQTPR